MKKIAYTLLMSLFIFPTTQAGMNYRDELDQNQTPAPQEERENERGNMPDHIDLNETPAEFELREQEERIEKEEYIGPEYDLLDDESVDEAIRQ
jgi:hypothetical protein